MTPPAMTAAPIAGAGSGPGGRSGAAGPFPAGKPDAIADALAGRPRGARGQEAELEPWTERF